MLYEVITIFLIIFSTMYCIVLILLHIFALSITKNLIMDINNNKAQMRKGVLEYCTLLILKNKDCYSTDILEKLKSAEMIVVEGTLYPLLTRLKNMELLNYRWEESTQGPPRKYYSFRITSYNVCYTKLLRGWKWNKVQLGIT